MPDEQLTRKDFPLFDVKKQKQRFLLVAISTFVGVGIIFAGNYFVNFPNEEVMGTTTSDESRVAIQRAYEVYEEYRVIGLNMEKGPCLTNDLMDDWVLDIAHDPRQEIDNDSGNQCKDYLFGEKSHFVELSPDGELIRAL